MCVIPVDHCDSLPVRAIAVRKDRVVDFRVFEAFDDGKRSTWYDRLDCARRWCLGSRAWGGGG